MSQNYGNVLEQMLALGRFGQTAYRSGELSQEQKKQVRKFIFSYRSRVKPADDKGPAVSLSESIDLSREVLDDYIHDYGSPNKVPDLFFNHLDDIKDLVKVIDKENDDTWVDVIEALCDRFNRVGSKILRLAFEIRAPPMQLPSSKDLYIPKDKEKSAFD